MIPGDVLPPGPEVGAFGQPCEHGITPNACAAGYSRNKAAFLGLGCTWSPLPVPAGEERQGV